MKKLFLVRTEYRAQEIAKYFPDFDVKGFNTDLCGRGYDVIVVAFDRYNDTGSEAIDTYVNNRLEYLKTKLLGKDSEIIIL